MQKPWFADDIEDRPTLRAVRREPVLRAVDAVALDALIAASESPGKIVVAPTSNSTVMITSKAPVSNANHADVSAAFSTIVEDDLHPVTTKGVVADVRAPARRKMRDDGAVPASRTFGAGMLQARGLHAPQVMPAPVESPAGTLIGAGMLQANRPNYTKLIVVLVAIAAILAAFVALR